MTRLDKPDEALEWLAAQGPRQLQVWYPNGNQPLGVLVLETNTFEESRAVFAAVKLVLDARKSFAEAERREKERAERARLRGPELLAKARAVCDRFYTPDDPDVMAELKRLIREIDEPEVNLIGGGT